MQTIIMSWTKHQRRIQHQHVGVTSCMQGYLWRQSQESTNRIIFIPYSFSLTSSLCNAGNSSSFDRSWASCEWIESITVFIILVGLLIPMSISEEAGMENIEVEVSIMVQWQYVFYYYYFKWNSNDVAVAVSSVCCCREEEDEEKGSLVLLATFNLCRSTGSHEEVPSPSDRLFCWDEFRWHDDADPLLEWTPWQRQLQFCSNFKSYKSW